MSSASRPGPDGEATTRPGRRGRRPGASDARAEILAAARSAFAERGVEGATVREVAARAGVDPALVHHYFGSKQRLFMAAIALPEDVSAVFPGIAEGPPELVGQRIIRTFVEIWDRPDMQPIMLGVVRSATADPVAAAMFRGVLVDGPLRDLARLAGTPDGPLRATLVGSQLIGLAMARYIGRLEPLASMSPGELAAAIGPTITRYLSADLGL